MFHIKNLKHPYPTLSQLFPVLSLTLIPTKSALMFLDTSFLDSCFLIIYPCLGFTYFSLPGTTWLNIFPTLFHQNLSYLLFITPAQ